MNKKQLFILAVLAAALAGVIFAMVYRPGRNPENGTSTTRNKPTTTQEATTVPPPSVVTFMAVGDNLIHNSIFKQAKARARGGAEYDFAPAYEGVRDIIARADLALINQETSIAAAVAAVSSYPLFCSPPEVGDAVYDLGFRAIQVANNHVLDKREAGVLAHLAYWDSKSGVCAFGAYRDGEDFATPHIKTVGGITFGFVGATFSYNGLVLPQSSPLVLPRLEQEELLKLAINIAREHADVVVVCPHWGNEDSTRVSDEQRSLARKFVEWGADMVIGNHPHVLQTMEFLDRPTGGRAFVAYSLGNFISAQSAAPNLVGGVLELTVTMDNTDGTVTITSPRFLPVVTQYEAGYANVRLIPWARYTPALGSAHGVKRKDSRFGYNYIERLLREIIPEEILVLG